MVLQLLSFYVDTGFWNWLGLTIGLMVFTSAIVGFWSSFWGALLVNMVSKK